MVLHRPQGTRSDNLGILIAIRIRDRRRRIGCPHILQEGNVVSATPFFRTRLDRIDVRRRLQLVQIFLGEQRLTATTNGNFLLARCLEALVNLLELATILQQLVVQRFVTRC